ncbi:MAG: hypothetical protein NTY51_00850 [Deltaproteobacteria bacterium]|nr:hypothetical protein [Deltaproteobacteria bacterium]
MTRICPIFLLMFLFVATKVIAKQKIQTDTVKTSGGGLDIASRRDG